MGEPPLLVGCFQFDFVERDLGRREEFPPDDIAQTPASVRGRLSPGGSAWAGGEGGFPVIVREGARREAPSGSAVSVDRAVASRRVGPADGGSGRGKRRES